MASILGDDEPPPGTRYFERVKAQPTLAQLLEFGELSPTIRAHLRHVYSLLLVCVGCATAGVFLDYSTGLGSPLWSLVVMGLMVVLACGLRGGPDTLWQRVAVLLVLATAQGLAIAPLVNQVAASDPLLPLVALGLTTLIFACFSVAALLAKRRSYLYLGAGLASCLLVLVVCGLVNMFLHSAVLFNVWLYLGLLMTLGFIVYDTQVIIERCDAGDDDVVWHALDLFIDFVSLFVRILIILNRRSHKSSSSASSSSPV